MFLPGVLTSFARQGVFRILTPSLLSWLLCVGGLRWLGVTHVTYLDRTYLAVARLVTQIDLSVKLYNHGEGSY